MASRINPAFHRHPQQGRIVGRILAAFGELEFTFCRNAGTALDNLYPVLKALYRIKTTSARIASADALTRPLYRKHGLGDEYVSVHAMMGYCLRIRNQYAHCNWADGTKAFQRQGLFFADVEDSARGEEDLEFFFLHVSVSLLRKQEDYFAATLEWLEYLNHELGFRAGRIRSHNWPKPSAVAPPPQHNDPEQHIPPWLRPDEKERHVAKALARRGVRPTPTVAQKSLDAARAAKRAQKDAHRARSHAGHSSPKKK